MSRLAKAFICGLILMVFVQPAFAQTKEQIIDNFIKAFNERNIDQYVEPLDDSVREFKFPDKISEKGKVRIRAAYESAFKVLGGQIEVLGKSLIGDLYVIDQRLKRSEFQLIDQYVLFKFKGNKIIEIHYLPKNFSW